MFRRWIALFDRYKELLTYLFFGVVTTAVSYGVYFLLYNKFHCYASVSNAISWLLAVIVAYLTNKTFVFRSHDWALRTVFFKFCEFAGLRVFTGVLETAIIFLLCDRLNWNGNWVKIGTSIFVIVLNYLASKFIVFRKKKQ